MESMATPDIEYYRPVQRHCTGNCSRYHCSMIHSHLQFQLWTENYDAKDCSYTFPLHILHLHTRIYKSIKIEIISTKVGHFYSQKFGMILYVEMEGRKSSSSFDCKPWNLANLKLSGSASIHGYRGASKVTLHSL